MSVNVLLKSVLFFIIGVLFSCNQSNKKFEFSEIQIQYDNEVIIEIDADGGILDHGKLVGEIDIENTAIKDLNGQTILSFVDDEVYDKKGVFLFKADKQGTINANNRSFKWTKDGVLVVNGTTHTSTTIKPVDNKSYQIVSAMLFLYK